MFLTTLPLFIFMRKSIVGFQNRWCLNITNIINMKKEENYIEINKESWNNRTDVHLNSDFYDLDGFMKGKSSLNSIELELLGDVYGKSILHLQCHFGQDTLSLSRMGAKVTGI